MKVNSLDNQPRGPGFNPFWVFLGVFWGFILFMAFNGVAIVTKYGYTFIKNYWHFMILGGLALLFIIRWFKKTKHIVQVPVQQQYG